MPLNKADEVRDENTARTEERNTRTAEEAVQYAARDVSLCEQSCKRCGVAYPSFQGAYGQTSVVCEKLCDQQTQLQLQNAAAQSAQQVLKRQNKKHQSYFGLLKAKKAGTYDGPVNAPHYRKKGGYDSVVISGKYLIRREDKMAVPMSREFRKKHPGEEILIPISPRIADRKIHQVEIIPSADGSYLDAVFVYEEEASAGPGLDQDNVLSLDPGLENFLTGVCTNGTSFIVDGRKLKSWNQWYNKQKAKKQSKLAEDGRKWSRSLTKDARKREHRIVDFMHKAANEVIAQAEANGCGTIVIGVNKGQKQKVCLGHITNQNFVQIPHARFRRILNAKCGRAGICYVEQEESYTSKASARDADFIPKYGDEKVTPTFSGKRIRRGLYRAGDGTILNADVNGAWNIMRKSKQEGAVPASTQLCRGVLDTPVRIRVV